MADPTCENIALACSKLIIHPGDNPIGYLELVDRDDKEDYHNGLGPIHYGQNLEHHAYPGRQLLVDAHVIEQMGMPELHDHSVTAYRNLTGFTLEMLPGMIRTSVEAGADHLVLPYPGTNNWQEPNKWIPLARETAAKQDRKEPLRIYMWCPHVLGGTVSGAAAHFGFDGIITHTKGIPSAKEWSEGKPIEIVVEIDDGGEFTATQALQAGADKVIVYGIKPDTSACVTRVQELVNEIIEIL